MEWNLSSYCRWRVFVLNIYDCVIFSQTIILLLTRQALLCEFIMQTYIENRLKITNCHPTLFWNCYNCLYLKTVIIDNLTKSNLRQSFNIAYDWCYALRRNDFGGKKQSQVDHSWLWNFGGLRGQRGIYPRDRRMCRWIHTQIDESHSQHVNDISRDFISAWFLWRGSQRKKI